MRKERGQVGERVFLKRGPRQTRGSPTLGCAKSSFVGTALPREETKRELSKNVALNEPPRWSQLIKRVAPWRQPDREAKTLPYPITESESLTAAAPVRSSGPPHAASKCGKSSLDRNITKQLAVQALTGNTDRKALTAANPLQSS